MTLLRLADFERAGLLDDVTGDEERRARADLLEELSDAGVTLDELRRAVAEERLALLPVELVFARNAKYTISDVARETGFGEEAVLRNWLALGLPRPGPDDRVFSDAEVEGLGALRRLQDLGVPEEAQLELARAVGQGAARIAETALQVLGGVFMRPGDTERDLGVRYADAAAGVVPLIGPGLENPIRLHVQQAIRRQVMGRAERAAGRLPGARDVAVGFADLVGFTRLSESLPESEIGDVAGRLTEMAAGVARPPVRLVKMIGDAAMFVSVDAAGLVRAALELVALADAEGGSFPRLHVGIAFGPALNRYGDWYGRPVNLASRVTSIARPGSVLVTEELRRAGGDRFEWTAVAGRKFKGVEERVALFRARTPA